MGVFVPGTKFKWTAIRMDLGLIPELSVQTSVLVQNSTQSNSELPLTSGRVVGFPREV